MRVVDERYRSRSKERASLVSQWNKESKKDRRRSAIIKTVALILFLTAGSIVWAAPDISTASTGGYFSGIRNFFSRNYEWFEYWYTFPLAIVVATLCNAAGFSGSVLFQPIFNIFMKVPIQYSVVTGIATEAIGMTSGALRYKHYNMIELPIGFVMLMLTIPGVILGNYALLIVSENVLKLVLGFVLTGLATMQLYSAARNVMGTRKDLPIEEIYGYMWVPSLGGFFSATTGTGMAELCQPTLEKGLNLQNRRANATAIFVNAIGDWIITILNVHAGLILLPLIIWTGPGVIIGGQLGPYISKYLPTRLLKIIFSICITVVAVFYIFSAVQWLTTR